MARWISIIAALIVCSASPVFAQDAQARLWDATIAGDTVAIAAALSNGAKLDAMDFRRSENGRLALNLAAINNRAGAIRFLLKRGAAIEGKNVTGFTALHHAAEMGSMDAARALLDAGADPASRNNEGWKPAEVARDRDHTDVATLIEAAERGKRPTTP